MKEILAQPWWVDRTLSTIALRRKHGSKPWLHTGILVPSLFQASMAPLPHGLEALVPTAHGFPLWFPFWCWSMPIFLSTFECYVLLNTSLKTLWIIPMCLKYQGGGFCVYLPHHLDVKPHSFFNEYLLRTTMCPALVQGLGTPKQIQEMIRSSQSSRFFCFMLCLLNVCTLPS